MNPLEKPLFFGCDMLEFNVIDIKTDTFFSNYGIDWNINTSNTNRGYIDLFDMSFSYQKIFIKGYKEALQFSLVIDGIIIDCFILCFGTEIFHGKGRSKDKVCFYSSFFILENLGRLPFSLYEFFGFLFNEEKCKLYRLDVALDLATNIKELQETIFKNTHFFSQIGDDLKHPEFSQTYYIKNPQSSQNSRYVIRIYDKILDSFKKKKGFLYPHLQNNFDVRRIEIEFRKSICQKFHYIPVSDFFTNKNNVLEKIYIEFLNKNIYTEYKLQEDFIYKIPEIRRQKIDLKQNYLELGHIPLNYLTQAYGYIKTIITTVGRFGLLQLLTGGKKNIDGQYLSFVPIAKLTELFENLLLYMLKEKIPIATIKSIFYKIIK